MRLTTQQIEAWRSSKERLLLPIIYIRGFAMNDGEISETSADPFNGFNIGSTHVRTGWTGTHQRYIFESPVLRLTQPPYGYRVVFSNGIRGLDPDSHAALVDWRTGGPDAPTERPPTPGSSAVLAIYRYYDEATDDFGSGRRPGMRAYGWGLARLIQDVLSATQAPGVYLVAHSMGGLVARTLLQNESVLNDSAPIKTLLRRYPDLTLSQAQWNAARTSVRRLFTYGTPHNGISGHGGMGNALLGLMDSLGVEIENFNRDEMRKYLGNPPEANSLDNKFPIGNVFCLVGTAADEYTVARGWSSRLVGTASDGLVELDNAVVHAPTADGKDTTLAARAYVRRAHSGQYGLVNSEEGFANLSRFLFGDLRVDGELVVQEIGLPPELAQLRDADRQAGRDPGIRASYQFEVFLRVRGAVWALTERLLRDNTAIFRQYDELFPREGAADGLDAPDALRKARHRRIDLFSAFLDTSLRSSSDLVDKIGDKVLTDSLGFALELRVNVPDYERHGMLWRTYHYEGAKLLNTDMTFLAYRDGEDKGKWGLAYGRTSGDTTNTHMSIVPQAPDPANPPADEAYWVQAGDSIEFWIPVNAEGPPVFRSWLRLTGRLWNAA